MIDNSNFNLKESVEKKRTFNNITTKQSFSQKNECKKSQSSQKTPALLSIGYVPKKRESINQNKSSTILHLMDYNNAEDEIKNAIVEMKKGLLLEMKNHSNDLLYLIDENKQKEKLISIKNKNPHNIPVFNNKEYIKDNIDNIDIYKNNKNIEIKKEFESRNEIRKCSKTIFKTKNKTVTEEKYRFLSHGCLIIDSNDDSESDEELDPNEYYINPETNFFLFYDFIITLCVFYSLLYLPLELANSLCICSPNINYIKVCFNIFIEILFLFDLIINFFLGYYNEEDKLIKKSKKIIKNYILGYFFVDLLSSIPFNAISFFYCKKNSNQICLTYESNNIFLLLLTCLKAIKIFKILGRKKNQFITKIIEKRSDFIFLDDLLNILSNIFFVILGFHIVTCIHIYIGRQTFPSWIHKNGFQNYSSFILYIISIYYIITTMTTVGYGDIQGDSFLEIIFRIILLAIGIVVYSWLISSISNSINKESFASINYTNECKVLEEIRITHSKLPYSLYSKIINYLKAKHFYQTKYDKNLLIKSLPYTIKNDLYLSMYKLPLKRFYFFKGISNSNFLVDILSYYSPKTASKDEILIKEDDIIEEILYVREGKLSLEIPINIDNPEESINKYLSYDFLEYAFDLDYSHKINQNNNNTNLSICSNKSNISFIQVNTYNKNNEKEEIIDNNIHLKVHNIFKNEDYGSIFMFFGKRSPFAVRVKSKKVKLFVLKKSDFSKLCSQYKNVIRRIQKKKKKNIKMVKSIFIKIIARFCDVKGIKIDDKFNKIIKRAMTKLNKEIIPKDILKNIEIEEHISDSIKDFDSKLSFFQSSLSSKEKIKILQNLKKSFTNIENYKSLLYRDFILSNKYESKYYSYSKGNKLSKKLQKTIMQIKEKIISKITSNTSYKKRFYFSESSESETFKLKSESGPKSMEVLPESLKISLKNKIIKREKEEKKEKKEKKEEKNSNKKENDNMNERLNYSSYSTFKNINNYINHQKLIHKYINIRRFSGTNLCTKRSELILDDLDNYKKSESSPKEKYKNNFNSLISTSVESFEIESSYKNLNEVTNGKLIKNKKFQIDTINFVKNYDNKKKTSCKKIDKSSKKGIKKYTLSYGNQKTKESKNKIISNKKLYNKSKEKLAHKFSNKKRLYKNDITTNENIQSNIKYKTLSSDSNSTQKEIYINSFINNNISNHINNINNIDNVNKIVHKNG